ncbi:MAG: hypothetical protein ACLFSW_03515 [Halobacteriales archaeon]
MTETVENEIRAAVHDDLADRGFDCPGCGGGEFEIDIWGVGDGINGEEVRAAAVCDACGARLNVRVDSEILDRFL